MTRAAHGSTAAQRPSNSRRSASIDVTGSPTDGSRMITVATLTRLTASGTARERSFEMMRVAMDVVLRLSLLVLAASVGCTRGDEAKESLFSGQEEPAPTLGPMRYGSTIEAARRPDETITTLLEVALPANGRMRAIVGVVPGDGPGLTTQIWTFDQRETGVLAELGERTPALRMRASDPGSPALAELRVELATPGAAVHRLRGIDAADPAAVLAAMTSSALVVRDLDRLADARLTALATVVRGLDDGPLLEQDALGRALDELTSGRWALASVKGISERRAEVTTASGTVLELHRKGDGWAIAAVR
jgi:hypothetical protein